MDSARALGKAGELRVQSELLLRNINSAVVVLDDGCDLILDSGKKLQVKACRKGERTKYMFTFMSGTYRAKDGHRFKKPQDLSKVDFVICWCVEDNWFLIIPAEEITGSSMVIHCKDFPNKTKSKYIKYLNGWGKLKGEV